MNTKLERILGDVRVEIRESKEIRPIREIKAMIKDAPPRRDFSSALKEGFGLIAEIKEKSPSAGAMRAENVNDSYLHYEKSPLVRAISVLTNKLHFGMSIARLEEAKKKFSKPILRKDFILDDYQVYEARAFGADAVLLMGNVLDKGKLDHFWRLATDIGLEVLFEAHTLPQIKKIPRGAVICGINCRDMDSSSTRQFFLPISKYAVSRTLYRLISKDLTTDLSRFEMIDALPHRSIKVAESGISPSTIHYIRSRGYNSALIGTALLTATEGLPAALNKFKDALDGKVSEQQEVGAELVHSAA